MSMFLVMAMCNSVFILLIIFIRDNKQHPTPNRFVLEEEDVSLFYKFDCKY